MAQIARTGTEKAPTTDTAKTATGNVADLRARAADQAGQAARDAGDRVEGAARRGAETVRRAADATGEAQRELAQRSTEGTRELGRVFAELANEQARHNAEALRALAGAVAWDRVARAVDWRQVLEIQNAYLRASVERAVRFNRRYLEASQALMTSAASTARRQADKAA